MNNKILGLDISRNFAVAYVLETLPENPKQHFSSFPKKEFERDKKRYQYQNQSILLTNDLKGIETLRKLKPTHIILEPTGYHYSAFWAIQGERMGAKIIWISHQGLSASREHYGFKSKTDDIDAFCLALTYLDPTIPRDRFLKCYQYGKVADLRNLFFERKRLLKCKNQSTNQIRQFLCIEFPEIAERDMDYIGVDGLNPTLAHIAGIKVNRRIPKQTVGTGITERTKCLAIEIMGLQSRVVEAESKLESLLSLREFIPYVTALKRFGFGLAMIASLLVRIYPLEKFYLDGKPIKDRKNHDISLRRFQAYLGLGFHYSSSGDTSNQQGKTKKKWQGSTIARSDLYAWLLTNPVKKNTYNPKTEIQNKLAAKWLETREMTETKLNRDGKEVKTRSIPTLESLGKDGICRFLFYLTRLMWYELKTELDNLDF